MACRRVLGPLSLKSLRSPFNFENFEILVFMGVKTIIIKILHNNNFKPRASTSVLCGK